MPQNALAKILLSAERVEKVSVLVHRDGVDREVTASEILFERDVGSGVKHEALVARRRLAFSSGEGVFLMRDGVKKDWKVGSYGLKAFFQHGFRRRAHHDPVSVARYDVGMGFVKQGVADVAADGVDLGHLLYGKWVRDAGLGRMVPSILLKFWAEPCSISA